MLCSAFNFKVRQILHIVVHHLATLIYFLKTCKSVRFISQYFILWLSYSELFRDLWNAVCGNWICGEDFVRFPRQWRRKAYCSAATPIMTNTLKGEHFLTRMVAVKALEAILEHMAKRDFQNVFLSRVYIWTQTECERDMRKRSDCLT